MNAAPESLAIGFSPDPSPVNDEQLVARIIGAYRFAIAHFDGHGNSFWGDFNRDLIDLHTLLLSGDAAPIAARLRTPHTTELLKGFYDLTASNYDMQIASTVSNRDEKASQILSLLFTLAEAVGAVRAINPEGPIQQNARISTAEALLNALDDKFGFRIDFPNPYPNEFGLITSRGVANFRSLHAIYHAWRLADITRSGSNTSILEIGAGLARTAYYAKRFGIHDYTIVDIPLTNVAQADFIGRTLGPSHLVLFGEPDDVSRRDRVRVVGPKWLANTNETFDIALNIDSITEMDLNNAIDYFRLICAKAGTFISINHEVNLFSVADLPTLAGEPPKFNRYPYWLRPGYVEEVAYIRDTTPPDAASQFELKRLAGVISRQSSEIEQTNRLLHSRIALLRRALKLTFRKG